MKNKSVLLVLLIMVSFTFVGCNQDGIALFKAYEKSRDITSYGFEGECSIEVDILEDELEESETSEEVSMFLPMKLNASFDGKAINDYEKAIKQEMNIEYDFMDLKTDLSIFSEVTFEDKTSHTNMFIEVPKFIKNIIGLGRSDAKYLYYGTDSLNNLLGDELLAEDIENVDSEAIKNMQESSFELLEKIKDALKENSDLVKATGNEKHIIDGVNRNLKMYEINLSKQEMLNVVAEILNDDEVLEKYVEMIFDVYSEEMLEISEEEMLDEIKEVKEYITLGLFILLQELDDKSEFNFKLGVYGGHVVYQRTMFDVSLKNNINIDVDLEYKMFDINKEIEVNMPDMKSSEVVDLIEQIQVLIEMNSVTQPDIEIPIIEENIDVSKYMAKEAGKVYNYMGTYFEGVDKYKIEIVKDNFIQERYYHEEGDEVYLYRVDKDKVEIVNFEVPDEGVEVDLTKESIEEEYVQAIFFNPAYKSTWYDEEGTEEFIVAKDWEVVVPAGTFNTVVVMSMYDDGSFIESYYAENIGLVMMAIYDVYGEELGTYYLDSIE